MPSGTALRIARPTLSVDGAEKAFLAQGLLGLTVVESVAGLFRCEAVFGNWGLTGQRAGFLYFDRALLDFGKPFRVDVEGKTLFDGRITGLEAHFPEGRPPELTVLAEDRFQDLRMTRRTRTFTDVSDADVMSAIAGDHGLTPEINVSGPTHKVLSQVNQSDLAFIRERARTLDAELWMEDRTLHVTARANRGGSRLQLAWQGNLREFSVLADLAPQRSSVQVTGWDVSNKSAITHEATESAVSSEVGGDTSGISILASALGSRKESVAHGVPLSSDEARTRAESCLKFIARRFVTARGVAEIDPQLRAGSVAQIEGLGPLFSGRYYVSDVRHRFDGDTGMRTEFGAERPGIGQP
jgi:Bacteriophage probable baseplate hub protein